MRTMMLDCHLTDDEKIDRGEALSSFVQDLKKLEDEKKASNTEFKEKIDNKTFEVRHLAKVIKQGFEERAVEIREVKDYDRKTIDIFRIDTGERVSPRSMAIEDAQESLFDDDRHKGKITVLGGN